MRRIVAGILLSLAAGPVVYASSLQISPVMVDLQAGQSATGISLRNPGDQPLYGQVRVFRWDQRSDDDVLEPTDEVVASPPMIRIPSRGEQLVRLIRRDAHDATGEHSYRVLVDEIPGPETAATNGVTIRLRYSVPVFIEPPGQPGAPQLTWQLQRDAQGWLLRVSNRGSRRGQLSAVQLVTADGKVHLINQGLLGYALAGKTRQWRITLREEMDLQAPLKIRANINAQPAEAELSVDPQR
ncbi:fimbrial biogenesis chaperone [Dyella koreensis]|uniref:Molecular chaperone n=1 Tax=Dyella koreensis TaxID=311235 RepID=A0ABW8K4S3_9GAMM